MVEGVMGQGRGRRAAGLVPSSPLDATAGHPVGRQVGQGMSVESQDRRGTVRTALGRKINAQGFIACALGRQLGEFTDGFGERGLFFLAAPLLLRQVRRRGIGYAIG